MSSGPDWLPINTAPKDGTSLLLAYEGRLTIGRWQDRVVTVNGKEVERRAYWFSAIDFLSISSAEREAQPTHWQPLPALPNG